MAVSNFSPHDAAFSCILEALEGTLSMRVNVRVCGVCQCVGSDVSPAAQIIAYVNGLLDLAQHSSNGLADKWDSIEKTGL